MAFVCYLFLAGSVTANNGVMLFGWWLLGAIFNSLVMEGLVWVQTPVSKRTHYYWKVTVTDLNNSMQALNSEFSVYWCHFFANAKCVCLAWVRKIKYSEYKSYLLPTLFWLRRSHQRLFNILFCVVLITSKFSPLWKHVWNFCRLPTGKLMQHWIQQDRIEY